jgi:hypothetical protein
VPCDTGLRLNPGGSTGHHKRKLVADGFAD